MNIIEDIVRKVALQKVISASYVINRRGPDICEVEIIFHK